MQRQTEDGAIQKSPPSGLTAQTAPGDAIESFPIFPDLQL